MRGSLTRDGTASGKRRKEGDAYEMCIDHLEGSAGRSRLAVETTTLLSIVAEKQLMLQEQLLD